MSSRRRGATDLAGILLLDKPAGPTSHDVVAAVRGATGEGRVGHAGTLDPMATGLLVVLVGPFTRLEPYLSAATKSYTATIAFGAATDTDDAEGAVIAMAEVPLAVLDAHHARAALDGLLGDGVQTPPAYSAIKVAGRTAHKAARAGEALQLAPRAFTVTRADLLAVRADPASWDVALEVSKGTYVRAIARDLGEAEGTRAHLSALRRTASGALDVRDAHTLEEITAAAQCGGASAVAELFADPLVALALPTVEGERASVASGRPLPRSLAPADASEGSHVAATVGGMLAAVYRVTADSLAPEAVMLRGDAA
jgi:tRNA pseudouridine55 synthase